MSTQPTDQHSISETIAAINQNFNTFAPLVVTAVMTAEGSGLPGDVKQQKAVASVLAVAQATAKTGEVSNNPNVQVISQMVDAVVSIFNLFGHFTHKQ